MIYEINYAILYMALRDRVRELGYAIDSAWERQVLTVSRNAPLAFPVSFVPLPEHRCQNCVKLEARIREMADAMAERVKKEW